MNLLHLSYYQLGNYRTFEKLSPKQRLDLKVWFSVKLTFKAMPGQSCYEGIGYEGRRTEYKYFNVHNSSNDTSITIFRKQRDKLFVNQTQLTLGGLR